MGLALNSLDAVIEVGDLYSYERLSARIHYLPDHGKVRRHLFGASDDSGALTLA